MIDIHTHTSYSDGTWSVKELLDKANKSQIEILSITDHDTLKPYKELEENNFYKEIYKGKIINGVEFNTVSNGIKIEVLAYDFDVKKLYEWVRKNYEDKTPNLKKEFNIMFESCKKNNIKMGDIDYDSNKWPVDTIFSEIKRHEENREKFKDDEWNDVDKFFVSSISKKSFPAYVDMSIHYPKIEEVTEAVHKAGGKVFVAHLYRYSLENYNDFLDYMVNNSLIDGVEVYHSSFNDEQVNTLREYCLNKGILMSGGTDCHGDKKADRKIGVGYGNMNIDKNIINWIK